MIDNDPSAREQPNATQGGEQASAPAIAQETGQTQNDAAARQEHADRQQRIRRIATGRRRNRRKQNAKFWIESASALATVGIACLTIAYVHYSSKQWQAAERSANAVRDQFNTMQRQMRDYEAGEAASIAIKHFAVTNFPDEATVVFDVVNEGRTRADLIVPAIGAGRIPPKDESKFFGQEHALGMIQPNINGFSLSPSDPARHISWRVILPGLYMPEGMKLPPAVAKVNQPTKEQLVKGDPVTVYVTVYVGYLDIFGNARQTSDCLVWNPQPKLFEPCVAQHDRHGY